MKTSARILACAVIWVIAALVATRDTGALAQQRETTAAPPAPSPHRVLLSQYCIGCHNERMKAGGLTLERIDVDNVRRRQQWGNRHAWRGLQEPAQSGEVPRVEGARIDVWNRPNKYGWIPLAIAVGYRFGNFKPSPDTDAALREVMIAAGVTPPRTINAKTQQIY